MHAQNVDGEAFFEVIPEYIPAECLLADSIDLLIVSPDTCYFL